MSYIGQHLQRFQFCHSCDAFCVAFLQEFVVLKGSFQQIWQSFEMTWRPGDRCGASMKLALRIFCFPVFYVQAVHCRGVHTAVNIWHCRHIRYMFYVLACPMSVLPCSAHAHIRQARLCPFGCRVFLGEYSFGRFPICSQERRSMAVVSTQFILAV